MAKYGINNTIHIYKHVNTAIIINVHIHNEFKKFHMYSGFTVPHTG